MPPEQAPPRDPPRDRVLAATVIWAVVTAPAFAIAFLAALMLRGSGATPLMWLAAALPLSRPAGEPTCCPTC
jgi:hypothetical protein